MVRHFLLLSTIAILISASKIAQDKATKPHGNKPGNAAESKEETLDAPDVADIPSQDLRIGKDENRRYLLAGPRAHEKEPKDGFGLLVIMPGGDGSANFHPFVKRIYKSAVPDGFIVVQPVAPKWAKDQEIIWPTEKLKTAGMKFTTEEFVEQIIEEVAKLKKIDAKRVYTVSWSSSGPAAYVIAARKKSLVHGSLVAMSVFHPKEFDIEQVKGRAYYLLHSPQDTICPFGMAEQARDTLRKAGATVELATYEGGHGWQGDVYGNIRKGVTWLEKQDTPR